MKKKNKSKSAPKAPKTKPVQNFELAMNAESLSVIMAGLACIAVDSVSYSEGKNLTESARLILKTLYDNGGRLPKKFDLEFSPENKNDIAFVKSIGGKIE